MAVCRSQCCSGFFRPQHLTELPVPDLQIKPMSLFGLNNGTWQHDGRDWTGSAYTSLQLATSFLQCEFQLPFWHTLMFGKVTAVEMTHRSGIPLVIPQPRRLSADEKAFTRAALERLALYVTFSIIGHKNRSGPATPPASWPTTAIDIDPIFKGQNCIVGIPIEKLDHLQNASEVRDSVLLVSLQLDLAVTLLHEIAHAARIVARPESRQDRMVRYYFSGQQLAEEGYEWEAYTFGGIITFTAAGQHPPAAYYTLDGQPSGMQTMLTLIDWPTCSIVKKYLRLDAYIGVRGTLREADDQWELDFHSAARLFTSKFWDNEVSGRGLGAFRLVRRKGIRFWSDCEGNRLPSVKMLP